MLDGILGSYNKKTGQLKVGGWGSPIEGYCVVQISILIFPPVVFVLILIEFSKAKAENLTMAWQV